MTSPFTQNQTNFTNANHGESSVKKSQFQGSEPN